MNRIPPALSARLLAMPAMTFPRTMEKVDRLIAEGMAPTPVVISVIASDPIFSSVLLGQAGIGSTPVLQLSQAVMRLGLGAVQGLARSLIPLPPMQQAMMRGYWAEATACGVMTRVVVQYRQELFPSVDDESAYSAGLVHNLGIIAAQIRFPEAATRASARLLGGDGPFHALLREEIGLDPVLIAAQVAMNWQLPDRLALVCTHYRHPLRAPRDQALCSAVHLARTLVRACGYTSTADPYMDRMDEDVMAALHLIQMDVPRLLDYFHDAMEAMDLYEVKQT
jgi:HD-like signal output (HDOD) protein